MKLSPPDPFILNLKRISNDLARLEKIADRASAASSNMDDYDMGQELMLSLRSLRHSLRDRMLEDVN